MPLRGPGPFSMPFAAAAALLAAMPATADDEIRAEIAAMKQRIAELEAKLEAGSREAEAPPSTTAVTGRYRGTGIAFATADGRHEIGFGGRVHAVAAFHDEDKSRLGDGTILRRARVIAEGHVFDHWTFKSEIDFSKGDAAVNDAFLGYTGFDAATLRIGHFKPPFSLDRYGSAKYISFMERAAPLALVPDRLIGIDAATGGDDWSATVGLFGEGFDDDPAGEGDEGWHAAARVTYAPIAERTRAIHLGAAAIYRDPNGSEVRFRERPETRVTSARFVDTGSLGGVDDVVTLGAEFAAVWGPLSTQAEYLSASVRRSPRSAFPALDDVRFDGWYAQAGYFLTGESRNYIGSRGVFGRTEPNAPLGEGGAGAWEVAARYSVFDLSDGSVRGGREANLTLGLNWYPTRNLRFTFNYTRTDNDGEATGNAANLKPGFIEAGDDDPEIYQIGAMVEF